MNRITVKPKNILGSTIVAAEIGQFTGTFKENVSFPVSAIDDHNEAVYQKSVPLTKEEYDAWVDDAAMEDLILEKLGLERAE